ncbi:MAG: hypothetical protein APU95_01385 [Hadesarchaea archaeon YNP_N21]|nr:MAG: hypothetical protein APU95_01385 [Hadesarchaea archaeon YNP_N21]
MRGVASACASATVINAFATGKGAAFAIDLRVRAEVRLDGTRKIIGKIIGEPNESPKLIEICVRKVLEEFKLDQTYGARVETTSDIPIAVGLSSSSAAANASVLATYAALGEKPNFRRALEIAIDAAFEAGVTITGAFDDASASMLGGGVITDNPKLRIIKRFRINPGLAVLVYVPPKKSYTAQIDVSKTKPVAKLVEIAYKEALRGNVLGALTLNGIIYSSALGYDSTLALKALNEGALAAGLTGKGPAVVAVVKPENAERVRRAWEGGEGKVISTKPSLRGGVIEAMG